MIQFTILQQFFMSSHIINFSIIQNYYFICIFY